MKLPQQPPNLDELLSQALRTERIESVLRLADRIHTEDRYLHWDDLRRRPTIEDFSHQEWWLALKLKRRAAYKPLPLLDKKGSPFKYYPTDIVQKLLHEIDSGAGGFIGIPDPATNKQSTERYIINSLIEEAITSSQLEGAVSTREVAKEMIKSGRKPHDKSERMILNNYLTMQYINTIKDHDLTPDLVFDIHRKVTEETLDKPDAAGRLRNADEHVKVIDSIESTVFHDPPHAEELYSRMSSMCDFANGKTPNTFIHPAVRAILLHFWLAYDHPFYDGNGRTARALFYWAMLKNKYWLFQYISISSILVKSPAKYGMSFLHSETDDNDLNYFIIYQTKVINRAIKELHNYIDRKQKELREAQTKLRFVRALNHRQQTLILHALRHPHHEYTVESHKTSHNVAYGTALSDLQDLWKKKLLNMQRRGRTMVFEAVPRLQERLKGLSRQ